jgi:adenylate cyclase
MISLSIRRKIMGIAIGLIVLMAVTAFLSLASAIQVGKQQNELTQSYIPAYGNLARANIRSVERALELRRVVIAKLRSPSNDVAALRAKFDAKGQEFESEIQSARRLISELIEKDTAAVDVRSLVRLQTRLDAAVDDSRRHLNDEVDRLLEEGNTTAIDESLTRVDAFPR